LKLNVHRTERNPLKALELIVFYRNAQLEMTLSMTRRVAKDERWREKMIDDEENFIEDNY
jgi:sporulation-control protein spo0M